MYTCILIYIYIYIYVLPPKLNMKPEKVGRFGRGFLGHPQGRMTLGTHKLNAKKVEFTIFLFEASWFKG